MLRLTPKGEAIFEAIDGFSLNEINAIKTIMYERVTEANFEYLTICPKETLKTLIQKGLCEEVIE